MVCCKGYFNKIMGLKQKKVIIAVPARLESKRLPNKILKDICGKPMLRWVLDNCNSCNIECATIVFTDSLKIKKKVEEWGFKARITSKKCNSGSQRIASVINDIVYDLWNYEVNCSKIFSLKECLENTLVINVQGDQPFIDPNIIEKIANIFLNKKDFNVITPIYKLKKENIHNPNVVKVLVSTKGEALYFSRSAIPHVRDKSPLEWHKYYDYWGHVGVYGYKASILSEWELIPYSKLEEIESLEQLKLIDSGLKIDTFETFSNSISVDTQDQLNEARLIASKIKK